MGRDAVAILLFIACPVVALADVCGSGTLDIVADSDTPVTLPTFNVGQLVRLRAVPTGVTISTWSWTIEGPLIKDYNERLGEASTGSLAWSTTPMSPSDLAGISVSFYWKPSPSQIDPLNGGPVSRTVTLTAQTGAGSCTVTRVYSVERNSTDGRKQANDFYTSNHPAPTETTPGKGVIIDDHLDWHEISSTRLFPDAQDFFRFHRSFLARFNSWRAEFGYPPLVPWYPGTPYPPGIDDVAFAQRSTTYPTDANQLYRPFTIAGGNADPQVSTTRLRLADYTDANDLDGDLEFGYHGAVHCSVGGTGIVPPGAVMFDDPVSGPQVFGDMCNFSSPKDPIFYPWHDFVDLIYENLCVIKGLTCPGAPPASTDVWMADNSDDLAAGGAVPSPPLHYISPDIWNRTSEATCSPPAAISGVVRDCGSSADHENPIAGQPNYLYATLRNDRPGATVAVYSEVAVYIANASTGLAWPANFGGAPAGIPLDETRHFITLNLAPGQTTSIGPIPWIPPNPTPSDHWCLYIRVLNVQDVASVETADVDSNTANSNSIAWRNLKIVTEAGMRMARWPFPGFWGLGEFVVRNVQRRPERVDLTIAIPKSAFRPGSVRLLAGKALVDRIRRSEAKVQGIALPKARRESRVETYIPLRILSERAEIRGIEMEAGESFPVALDVQKQKAGSGSIVIEQRSKGKLDGGVVLQLSKPGAQGASKSSTAASQ